MGEFQDGNALVIVTKDPLEAKMMAKLKESHNGGNLRLGNNVSPLASGVAFFDDLDLTRAHKSEMIRSEEARKAAKAYVATTESKLSSGGILFAVSPQVDSTLKDVRDGEYLLNFSPNGRKNIWGRFTKRQLDRIADGDYSDLSEG